MKTFLGTTFTFLFVLATLVAVQPAYAAVDAPDNSLVRGDADAAVYLYVDGLLHPFVNAAAFHSFNLSFDDLVVVPQHQIEATAVRGYILNQTQLIKQIGDPEVYLFMADGTLRPVPNEEVAAVLFGAQWGSMIREVRPRFFHAYDIGAPLTGLDSWLVPTPAEVASLAPDINTAPYTIVDALDTDLTLSLALDAVAATDMREMFDSEGDYTLFAPTNEAFLALGDETVTRLFEADTDVLSAILQYHLLPQSSNRDALAQLGSISTVHGDTITVVPGESMIEVNGSPVTRTIYTDNGIIHVIEDVLVPGMDTSMDDGEGVDEAGDESGADAEENTDPTVVGVVARDASLSMFADMIERTNMTATLQSDGPYTLFAPTNEAFEKLDANYLNSILAPNSGGQLLQIVLHHIIQRQYSQATVTSQSSIKSMQGGTISIANTGDGVVLDNRSLITDADMVGSNGVVHVIDTVLMP